MANPASDYADEDARMANSPTEIPRAALKVILLRVWRDLRRDNVVLVAARATVTAFIAMPCGTRVAAKADELA